MIEELRDTLTQRAAQVVPLPDPYLRLVRRRRRRRQAVGGVAAVLALAIVLPGAWLLTRDDHGVRHSPSGVSPLLAQLLDSPTRGSLAADTGFLNRMRQKSVADEVCCQHSAG